MNGSLSTDCKTPHYAVLSVLWHIKIFEVRENILVRSICSNIRIFCYVAIFIFSVLCLSRGKICSSTLTLRKVDVYSPCGKNELRRYSFN